MAATTKEIHDYPEILDVTDYLLPVPGTRHDVALLAATVPLDSAQRTISCLPPPRVTTAATASSTTVVSMAPQPDDHTRASRSSAGRGFRFAMAPLKLAWNDPAAE